MFLTTQCPQCGEQFQTALAQLQLRKGYVRCVRCAHIFDGYEAVVSELPAAVGKPQSSSSPPASPAAAPENPVAAPFGAGSGQAPSRPAAQVAPLQSRPVWELSPGPASSDADETQEGPAVSPVVLRARVPSPEPVDEVFSFSLPQDVADRNIEREPVFGRIAEDAPSRQDSDAVYVEPRQDPAAAFVEAEADFLEDRRAISPAAWLWGILTLLGLVLLLAQTAVIYRVQIASQMPAARPMLERLCASWGCTVGYPRKLSDIAILSSSLRMQPQAGAAEDDPARLDLHLVLRNSDERAQQWPTLLLDLTDFSGAVVVRRHLQPADYLPPTVRDPAFAGRSELAVRIPLAVNGVKVNGYQLSPFFP